MQPRDGVPRVPVEELFPQVLSVVAETKLLRPNGYNLSWEEIVTLSHLVKALAPRRIFEFGTFDGRTTLHLALNSPADAQVTTIDIVRGSFDFGADTPYFKKVTVGECFADSPVGGKITMLTADTRKLDVAPYRGQQDLVFVDADHFYDGVINDSHKAFEMVRPGGVIVWHDYLMIDDVTRALIHLAKDRDLKNLKNLKGTTLVVWQVPA